MGEVANKMVNMDELPFTVVPKSEHVVPHVVLQQEGDTALLFRGGACQPYVIAVGYDAEVGDWSQGHYYTNLPDAAKRFELSYAPCRQDLEAVKTYVEMPERVIPTEDGGFRYIYWNGQHDGGEEHEGIAGCFEIHNVYAEDVIKCFEECGVDDFFSEITGFIHAFSQSEWCDGDHGEVFDDQLREYMFAEGYTFGAEDDVRAVVTALYDRAVEACPEMTRDGVMSAAENGVKASCDYVKQGGHGQKIEAR